MDQKDITEEWDSLTYEQKNEALFEQQKHTLEEFLEHGAISKQQYEKSLHDLTEKMGVKEYLDIVDESGHPTGETISRDAAYTDGILHRTAHVWVARKTDQGYDILLQKQSEEKDSFPGLYDTSSAGHIPAGDEPLESALRELKEDMFGCLSAPLRSALNTRPLDEQRPCENTSSIRFATKDLVEKILPELGIEPAIVHLVGTE